MRRTKGALVPPRGGTAIPAPYVSALQACYGGEHVLLERLPGLIRAVQSESLRIFLNRCQRWTVLRLSRLLPLVDACGPAMIPTSARIARLFTQARVVLQDKVTAVQEKDAGILVIIRHIHADQRQGYNRLQRAAEDQGNSEAAHLGQAFGDELAKIARLSTDLPQAESARGARAVNTSEDVLP